MCSDLKQEESKIKEFKLFGCIKLFTFNVGDCVNRQIYNDEKGESY